MKYIRGFAVGLLTTLSVLTTIYLLVTYVKFNPDEASLLEASKLTLFFKKAQFNKDYATIIFLTALSALSGVIFKKQPSIPVAVTALSFCYVLELYDYNQLTKRPMVITIFFICALFCYVAAAAVNDRFGKSTSLSRAGMTCTLSALVISGICSSFQYRLYSVKDMLQEIADANITLTPKVKAVPSFVRMIWMSLVNSGEDVARDANFTLQKQLTAGYMKGQFLSTLDPEDFPFCFALTVLIFGSLILSFALSRRYRLLTALISLAPFASALVYVLTDHSDTLPLPVITLLGTGFVCFFTEYDQHGKGHDTSYDDDDEPTPTEPVPEEALQDEIYYT
ncbi:MAG: hypothetical protein MJ137_05710 [Clostridia bacterium]|nr:hypothetical protein [Clostridia bacterium]